MSGNPWNGIELQFLIETYPDHLTENIAKVLDSSLPRVYNKAHQLGLKKSEAFMKSQMSGRLSKMIPSGVIYRFLKGHKPFNKGRKQEEYMSEEGRLNSRKTTFKKGNINHNRKADGEISIRTDEGRKYKYIRITNGVWKPLHVYEYEKLYGPVPEGMIVVFKNKDTMNCHPDNLELITRVENMKRNTVHRYPPELKFAMRKLNQLKRTINGKEQDSRPEKSSIRNNRVA